MVSFELENWYPKLFTHDDPLFFMQDLAGAHRGNIVFNAIEASNLNYIAFPSHSPDLNLIEAVWNWMDGKIKGELFDNVQDLLDQ